MHSVIAVESMTLNPLSITSRYEILSNRVARLVDHRVGRVDAVDLRAFENDVGFHFHRAERRRGVGREVRVCRCRPRR